MANDPKEKLSLDWMYEGPSSTVNQEDYLTGRKIGTAYEKSHFQEPPSKLEFVTRNKTVIRGTESTSTAARTSATLLDLDTVKKEDPLVAIKVREEKVRRDILDNPMKMRRLQKIVMKSMEKKMRKIMKKRHHDDSSSEESDDSDRQRHHHRRKSKSSERNRPRRIERKRSSMESSRKSTRSRSDRHSRDQKSPTASSAPKRKRHDSASSTDSASSNREKHPGYGLVHIKQRKEIKKEPGHRRESPKPQKKPESKPPPSKKPAWKPLSDEEMDRRRREMMENAKWRDEQRKKNLKRYERAEEEQSKRDTKQSGESVDFIRRMVASSTDQTSVEERVKSKVQHIQRSTHSMDSHFARK